MAPRRKLATRGTWGHPTGGGSAMPKPKGSGHERTSEGTGTWAPLFKSLRPPSGPGRSARCTQRVHRPGVGQRPAQVLRVPLFGPCSLAPGCCPGSGSFGTLREPPRSRGASTCSTDVRRGQTAALLAGALPERPRRRGRGEGRARVGAAGICSSDPLAASGPAWPRRETASGPVPEGETDAR